MRIVIVGAGPRGIAVALQAAYRQIPVTVVDPRALHTWRAPTMVPDLVMRSPFTFDLTTFCEELQEYSLCNFMNKPISFISNQKEIEAYPNFPTRADFIKYLDYIYRLLVCNPYVSFVQEEVKFIDKTVVITETDKTIDASHIVIATGNHNGIPRIPNWVALSQLKDKVMSVRDVITYPPLKESVAVVGSGQGAAELVNMLADGGNKVYWCINKELKVDQYPAPSYSNWGGKSALGGYYRLLGKPEQQMKYLKEVKEWQPSITPRIAQLLNSKDITIINPTSTLDLNPIFREVSRVVISAGVDVKLNQLPFKEHPQFNPYFPDMPLLTEGFKSSIPNIYFTGLLALSYDGPRQGSIISSASTARDIIHDITN